MRAVPIEVMKCSPNIHWPVHPPLTSCSRTFDASAHESQIYNCCLVTRTRVEMSELNLEPIPNGQESEVVWAAGISSTAAPYSFRGNWRSRHRREIIEAQWVPKWAACIACADADDIRWAQKLEALRICLTNESVLDAFVSLLLISEQTGPEEIAEAVRSVFVFAGQHTSYSQRFHT